MFSDKKSKKSTNTPQGVNSQNRISVGTKIVGDISSEGGFRIDGTVEGNISTSGKVVIGQTGIVTGNLDCTNADIEGKFEGKMKVTETLALKSNAFIEGEVILGKLSVEPGATFNATCAMNVKDLMKDGRFKSKAS